MIPIRLLSFIQNSKKRWFTSVVAAVLAVVAVNITSLADKPDRTVVPNRIADGVYLYGEVDRPDVIGKEYIVLEMLGNSAVGAFYLPRSEFSCFYGQFKGSRLSITLIDVYDGLKYHYTLSLNPRGLTASNQPMMGTPTYQPLGKISDNDRHILNTCKLELQNQR